MGIVKYSNEMLDLIKNEYLKGTTYKDIAILIYEKFNLKTSSECVRWQMKDKFKDLIFKKGKNPNSSFKLYRKYHHNTYSDEEIKFIKDNIKYVKTVSELAEIFNKKFNKNKTKYSIYFKAIKTLKLNKKWEGKNPNSEDYAHKCGEIFTKTSIKKDKNKKGVTTRFTTSKLICISKGKHQKYNNYIYEQLYNTKIPSNDTVINIDGNINNISKNNLLLVNKNAMYCFTSSKFDKILDFNIRKSAWLYCDLIARKNKFKKGGKDI